MPAIQSLVFATGNPNKVREIQQYFNGTIIFKSLKDIGCTEEIPETQPSIEGNAIQKAEYVATNYHVNCFAEDTGLEIEALHGEPGVFSARYAGPQKNADDNMSKVLVNLQNHTNRKARFKTVIALLIHGELHTFEGIINGTIAHQKKGDQGFGYDPIFVPSGFQRSFAEMSIDEKNKISHRARATEKLRQFLAQIA